MEHCGDDFLASLAESMQGCEDWDDLQLLETEACGTLADMFNKDSLKHDNNAINDDENVRKPFVHVLNDSPERVQKRQDLMDLDCISDDEDVEFVGLSKKDVKATCSSSRRNKGDQRLSYLDESSLKNKVRGYWFIILFDHFMYREVLL